ncbi:TPA: phosphate ABC transporter substrate-binding protein PstS [Thermoplasmata archaeon]|nr:phosphate ABC transporter substrate-binding protein PstS [Thermoplasmata archaeon]
MIVAAFAAGLLSSGAKDSVSLTGAGATFPMPLILKWADEYYNVTDGKVRVNYGGGGSGAGITQIKEKQVDFAGTDAPLSSADSSSYGLVHIPETLGAVVIAFNLPGIGALKLDGETAADIFMKNLTAWDDPAIAALNPGVTLPDEPIATVVRSDSSGTTFVFTGYLATVSPVFSELYGQGKTIAWPDGTLAQAGNSGVAQAVQGTSYSIGYIELAYALENDISHAQLKNKEGQFITASLDTTAAAAAAAVPSLPAGDGDWSSVNVLDAPGLDSYPIATFTYILVYKELYNDETKMNKTAAKTLLEFIWWAVHDDGQALASPLQYAPLPDAVVSLNEETLRAITYMGEPLID